MSVGDLFSPLIRADVILRQTRRHFDPFRPGLRSLGTRDPLQDAASDRTRKCIKFSRAELQVANTSSRSAGISSASMRSSAAYVPSFLAASIFLRPAAVINPSAIILLTRSLFSFDRLLPGLRGHTHSIDRSSMDFVIRPDTLVRKPAEHECGNSKHEEEAAHVGDGSEYWAGGNRGIHFETTQKKGDQAANGNCDHRVET